MANSWNDPGAPEQARAERSRANSGIDRTDLWGENDSPAAENELRVIDLLKRLETESDSGAAPVVERTRQQPTKWAQWDPEITCSACQYLNAADQKFCGYCGTSLQSVPAQATPQEKTYFEDPRVRELREEETRAQELRVRETREQEAREQAAREQAAREREALEIELRERDRENDRQENNRRENDRRERDRQENELREAQSRSLFEPERRPHPQPEFAFEERPKASQSELPAFTFTTPLEHERDVSDLEFLRNKTLGADQPNRNWRIPLAVAVLAIAGFVGYRMYNGLGLMPEQLSAVLHPATRETQPGTADQTPVADSGSSSNETVQEPAASLPVEKNHAQAARAKAAPLRGEDRAAVTPATQRSRESVASLPGAVTPGMVGGREELAQAQRYLAPATRDTTEAAKWLWKAVGKENPRAVLLLSDLYATGDGVAKSCDQARLLLTVAAKKGNSDAASRLSSLDSCQ